MDVKHVQWISCSAQETKLKAERDDKVRLRGQAGIHKRNGEELMKQMLQKEDELQRYKEEVACTAVFAWFRCRFRPEDCVVDLNSYRLNRFRERLRAPGAQEG